MINLKALALAAAMIGSALAGAAQTAEAGYGHRGYGYGYKPAYSACYIKHIWVWDVYHRRNVSRPVRVCH